MKLTKLVCSGDFFVFHMPISLKGDRSSVSEFSVDIVQYDVGSRSVLVLPIILVHSDTFRDLC